MPKIKFPVIKKPSFRSKKTIAIGVIVIAAIVAGGWFILNKTGKTGNGQKVYAEAAGHKVYKKEIDDLIGKHKEVTEHQAAQVLADKYFTEALAKERGITVTDKDLTAQFGKGALKQKMDYKYAYQNKLNQVYFTKLQANDQGIFKGKYLIANFSRHIPYKSPLLKEDEARDSLLGNSKAINRDKAYAKNLMDDLYSKINSGEITFNKAISIEQNDPVVGKSVYPTLAHSGAFDTSQGSLSGFVDINSLNIKAGQTSKPFVIKASDSADGKSTVESYYMIVRLDSAQGGGAKIGFKSYIEQSKERLGYKVYV
jgi:hypothetical protein